jgi:hypothetical protein
VIKNANNLTTKEKAGKFKLRHQKGQLSVALKTKEHRGCTRAISLIGSWKEGFTEDIHTYKKRGSHDKDAESANNDEEKFTTLFFNLMRKHALPNLLHLRILNKLLLLLKIHHLHNLLSVILHHVLLFQSLLLTLHILFKIHHLHNLLRIILYYVSLLLTLPLLKIHQLNKFFGIVLHLMLLFQNLLHALPILFKINLLHNLLSIILYYVSLLFTLALILLKIHQMNKLFSIIVQHMFIL